MAKVQVEQRVVGNTSPHRRYRFGKPNKALFPDNRERINSPNRTPTRRNVAKEEKKKFQNILKYYATRKLSVAVHCVALIITSIMIVMETESYSMHPTGTSVEDDMYPVQKMNFPGVSICSINVISRMEAMRFAETLWLKEEVQGIANLTLETVKYLMRYMGTLYQFEHKEHHPGDLLLLNEIFEKAFLEDYDVQVIMNTLTPKCRSFLTDCFWQGSSRKCDDLFVPRWTPEGSCCTFNYARWSNRFNDEQDADFKINVERPNIAGTEFGLYATLKPDLDDYYYTIIPGRGFKVLLYTASDYPDAPSGGLREVLLSPGSESFLTIKATSFYSMPDVIKYNKQQRQCLFNTELDEIYGGGYSYSQCMMFCRVSDVRRNCGCIPFFYPVPDDISEYNCGVRMCTVKDLVCLQRHKSKWWSMEPIASRINEHPKNFDKEIPDAHLRCDCWPSCEYVDYTVFKSSSSIHHQPLPASSYSCSKENFTLDHSVLSVSFESTGTVRLRQDVMFHWYDLMSNYGGLCCLFLGISIITPIELMYLLCLRFWPRAKTRTAKMKRRDQPIYWSEIMPPKRSV